MIYIFNPLVDITAYELALIYKEIIGPTREGVFIRDDKWKELPISIRRHFRKKEDA